MALRQTGLCYSPAIALIVLCDQLTKYLCVRYIDYGTLGIEILPFLNLVHVYNYGAAFSFLADMGGWQRWLFVAIAVIMCTVFMVLLVRTPCTQKLLCLAYALFIAGAAGNLIDRLWLGYVVDFILFYYRHDSGLWAYPAFNVADMAVSCGAALLVITAFFLPERRGAGRRSEGGRQA